jgi:predicted nucleic acid-binding protein
MNSHVIDASVVTAAFLGEPEASKAGALLISGKELFAPDLLYAETSNVLWKRRRRGEISGTECLQLMEDILRLDLKVTASAELVRYALPMSLETHRTVYDCLYVALAARNNTCLFTADKRLVNSLKGGPLAGYVAWIGDYS